MAPIVSTSPPPDGVIFVIDGQERLFPLAHGDEESPTIGVAHVGAFPPKQVIGDWSQTSHEVNSSLVQNSWMGGGQVNESQEAQDTDRYAEIASLETRFVRSLTLLPRANAIAGPNTNRVRMLGDLVIGGERRVYAAWGDEMRRIEGAALTTAHTLAAEPTGEGAVFRVSGVAQMFIPMGDAGYQTWDGTTLGAVSTAVQPLNFAVHSRKIWAIDAEGVIFKSLDGVTWIEADQVDPGRIFRGLVTYMDRSESPAIHVIADDGVFALDESVPALYQTDLDFPPHARSGLAWEKWRTDLYVGIGMGILRYTLGTINAAGVDRDDGPGPRYAGYVSQMERGFNDLFVGMTAFSLPGEVSEEFRAEQGIEVYTSSRDATCSVLRQTGGETWHTVWVAPAPGGEITTLMVSSAAGGYRLYWAWQGVLYYQELSQEFDNPKHNPTQEFEPEGELISSWFDMGMAVDRMTMAAIEARVTSADAQNVIEISYQIDDDDATNTWRPLATLTAPGYHQMRVGENGVFPTVQTVQTRYDGQGFGRMRYRVRQRSDNGKTPDLASVIIVFIKRMRRLRAFEMEIDCSRPENDAIWGYGNEERRQVLQRLIDAETFIPFLYKSEWVMVKMSYANGPEGVAQDSTGNLTITLLESWERSINA